MSKEKSRAEELKEKLFYNPKHASEVISQEETDKADALLKTVEE